MHRLLIVDDEPYILTALKEMFEEADQLELDIYTAGSASEALDWLNKTRIDIVLSDIRMPGMSGLELLERIRGNWPSCKVIFLTGHNEFDYVQEAIQNGSVGYLLKTDEEEDILQAIAKAIDDLTGEETIKSFIDNAKGQMQLALPVLRKDYFMSLAGGEPSNQASRRKRFGELGIDLDSSRHVMLVVGKVDRWEGGFTSSDKDLLLYAIQNIAYEVMSRSVAITTVVCDRHRFFWLLQDRGQDSRMDTHNDFGFWIRYAQDSLDFIQDRCRTLLHVPISLGSTIQPFEWEVLPEKYSGLNRLLVRGLGQSDEMLLYEKEASNGGDEAADEQRKETTTHRRQSSLNQLKTLLESGSRQAFVELFEDIEGSLAGQPYEELQETYYTVATLILAQINRWSVYDAVAAKAPLKLLFAFDEHGSWQESCQFLMRAADVLFEQLEQDNSDKSNEVIEKLHRYIQDHIDNDLSLVRLAEVVDLNASYLCRLYKQLTGIGLSEYITDIKLALAKQLLGETNLKVSEVAGRIGFDSGYFSRYFKKITTMTPQEYRERVTK